jgi:hypothetical protein
LLCAKNWITQSHEKHKSTMFGDKIWRKYVDLKGRKQSENKTYVMRKFTNHNHRQI